MQTQFFAFISQVQIRRGDTDGLFQINGRLSVSCPGRIHHLRWNSDLWPSDRHCGGQQQVGLAAWCVPTFDNYPDSSMTILVGLRMAIKGCLDAGQARSFEPRWHVWKRSQPLTEQGAIWSGTTHCQKNLVSMCVTSLHGGYPQRSCFERQLALAVTSLLPLQMQDAFASS